VPIGAALGDVSMTKNFSQNHSALNLPKGVTSEVRAISITLTAKNGVTDFSFIHTLHFTISDANNLTSSIELINYQQEPGATVTDTLTIISTNPANVLNQWMSDSTIFTIDISGTLPTNDWSADMVLRFSGSVKYSR
jgi:hypothetical protein